jgi:signal transduction histidine kinase/CheY-like chemotaxis protein
VSGALLVLGVLALVGALVCYFIKTSEILYLILFIASSVSLLAAGLVLSIGIGVVDRKQIAAREAVERKAQEEEKAKAARSVFLRNMAHDILTPIYGIQGMSNIARDNLRSVDAMNRCLSNISESADHLLSLVNNVLDVTHLESGKVELKSEPFNLLDTLTSLAGIVQGEIESTSIAFKTDFKGIIHPKVEGDQTQIKRALLNFLDNAVKLTPEGKGIDFEVKEMNDSRYLFSLSTSGEALSQSLLTALNSSAQTSGLESAEGGELSLRIARDLFAEMGGRITARNLPDSGHEILVSLPLKNPQEALTKKGGAYAPNLASKRILLVEDNAINQAIALYLLKPTQADIALAKNGDEAVQKFLASKEGSFSLILMDISMPVMDDYEATKRIRASGRKDATSTPILAMTANAFSEDSEKIFAAGMNEHLTKPIDKNLLYIALDTYKDGIPAKAASK